MPKSKTTTEQAEKEPVIEEVEEAPDIAEIAEVEPAAVPTTGRKALGGKEVIPFKWKLVGNSGGIWLTLFKAVEKDDVEAQLERIRREGYYNDLKVLDVAAKLDQPKGAKSRAIDDGRSRKPSPAVVSEPKQSAKRSGAAKSTVVLIDRKPTKKEKEKAKAKPTAAPSKSKAAAKSSSSKSAAKRPSKKK